MTRKKRISQTQIEEKTYDWLNLVHEGDVEKVKNYYEKHPYIDINLNTLNGNALHIALTSYEQREALIDYLVNLGVNIEAKKYNNGWTPLFSACNYALSHDKNLNTFLKYKPNIHITPNENYSGGTILHLLTQDKSLDKLRKFIDMGVNPYVLDKNEANILHLATQSNWKPIVQYLLEPQFNFNLNLIASNHRNEKYTVFDVKDNEIKIMLLKREEFNKIHNEKENLDKHVLNKNDKIIKLKI